uniref:GDSL esterase/lipase n=1 Tax=Noccaea caerulescens TaxID=107243 RepID=A0A1J3JPA8_NOCCA
MATERGISELSRPLHLTSIEWNHPQYRTSVMSCLVQGVYSMEVDRQKNQLGPKAQAPPWWDMNHFTLLETLIESDDSIYGAIFEYKYYNYYENIPSLRTPPRYVIAFRGTILKADTWFRDAANNLRIIFDSLHQGTRFAHAMFAIHKMVAKYNDASVWLTGHSLGAGLALLAGKTMARYGFFLETYIFNPPVSSFPLEQLFHSRVIKGAIRIAGCLVKAGVAKILKNLEVQDNDLSTNIASWTPYLYVNPRDPICSEYIGYFRNKRFMSKIGLSEIERIANENPLRSLFVETSSSPSPSYFSDGPLHLLPSAYMTVNFSESNNIRRAHGLRQWWDQSFNCKYVLYQFSS